MSTLFRRYASRPVLAATLLLVTSVGVVLPSAPAQAAGDSVTFLGHGWGHGRGMGQYGALGYAVDQGWTSAQILDHYYGGTVAGNVGNPEMTVELLGLTGKPLVVTGPSITVNGQAINAPAVRLTLQAGTTNVLAETGTGCASPGGWTPIGTFPANNTRVQTPSPDSSSLGDLLRVCEATDERAYRGELSVVDSGGTQMTINHLPTESYLRGSCRASPRPRGACSATGGGWRR
ncbi:hypothetical protein [Cellulomonas sp. P24]|uniref:hypothetical protein n=1 Tax=Cellulomonas sp. P24 TaxID=2885206 RepID=UPI00216AD8C0|nr:hypothetical protein [Cellulomonas sp. P24]MCR6491769.1 hypothetical protein [Cellulomonas sp. P24]